MVRLNRIPRVAVFGEVSRLDWLNTYQLTVTWFMVGCGEYQPQAAEGNPSLYPYINRAVDLYLNE